MLRNKKKKKTIDEEKEKILYDMSAILWCSLTNSNLSRLLNAVFLIFATLLYVKAIGRDIVIFTVILYVKSIDRLLTNVTINLWGHLSLFIDMIDRRLWQTHILCVISQQQIYHKKVNKQFKKLPKSKDNILRDMKF